MQFTVEAHVMVVTVYNYRQKCLLKIFRTEDQSLTGLKTDRTISARSLTLVIIAAVWALCG